MKLKSKFNIEDEIRKLEEEQLVINQRILGVKNYLIKEKEKKK